METRIGIGVCGHINSSMETEPLVSEDHSMEANGVEEVQETEPANGAPGTVEEDQDMQQQQEAEARPAKQRRTTQADENMRERHPAPLTLAKEFIRRPRTIEPEESLKPIDADTRQTQQERTTRTKLLLIGEGPSRSDAVFQTARELYMNLDNNWEIMLETLVNWYVLTYVLEFHTFYLLESMYLDLLCLLVRAQHSGNSWASLRVCHAC